MKRIDRRRVKTITEQATRNALKKQQLNEWGRVGSLIGKAATGLWNGGKNFFRGSAAGLGGRMGRMFGNGAKRYQRAANTAQDAVRANATKFGNAVAFGNPAQVARAEKNYIESLSRANRLTQDAQRLSRNKNLFRGALLGGLGTYGLMSSFGGGGSAGQSQYPYNELNGGSADPYADYYNGGYADPYAGYYTDPYAGYYSGGYADPYAGYYTDPYAAYYSGGYSTPSTGGGSSSGNQDLAILMMLANQNGGGGNSGGIDPALMMAALGGNMDPNDIWALGGYA